MTENEINEYKIMLLVPDKDFRETLKMLFVYSFEFEVTGLFKSLAELESEKALLPDIILAEIPGTAEVKRIKKEFPAIPIVVITGSEAVEKMVELFAAGASHYIFKGSEPAVYLDTLKEVLEDKIKISDSIIKNLITHKNNIVETSAQLPMLTAREKDILHYLSKGSPYKEIASELKISVDTVKRHCYNIYQKLGVDNKVEAINKVFR
ncbi:MAG: response regulator transcription factor [Agriterribacter sp.]